MAQGGSFVTTNQLSSELFDLRLEQKSPDTVDRIRIPISSKFSKVMGSEIAVLTEDEYLQLHDIVQAPEIQESDLGDVWPKLFPCLLQKMKLWGCNFIRPAKIIKEFIIPTVSSTENYDKIPKQSLLSFVNKSKGSTSNTREENPKNSQPVSRADFVTFLLFSVDILTAKSLLEVMSKFVLAMPLIIRDPQSEKYVLMIPLLRDILIKWEAKPGTIIENRLFRNACRLIVAVRIGSNNHNPGKSSILNLMLKKENIFSSRDEPGGKLGKPCTIDGSIEFIWLTEETASDTFLSSYLCEHYSTGKNELILLANMHGDVSEYHDTVTFLRSFNASFIAFLMPTATEDQVQHFLEVVPEGSKLHFIIVDHEDHDDSNPSMVSTSNLSSDVNLDKIRKSINDAIRTSQIQQDFAKISCQEFGSRLTLISSITTERSQAIVNFAKIKTCRGIRNILQLQKCDSYAGKSEFFKVWHGNNDLQFLIRLFIDLQKLPTYEFKKAITHLEIELSILSSVESQSAREKFIKYKECQRKLFQSATDDKQQLERQLKVDANSAMREIDDINLGVEHFFRELIQIYQANLFTTRNTDIEKDIFKLPDYSADLLLHGFAIEILNGDSGMMPVQWLTATCESINKIRPNLKVFVLSIIGLQSSGKSTLLNALFSCKFAVSVGRCSRGLFARLIFLDDSMKSRHNFDAFLLIDTEGLGSPEKMNDKDAEKKDRLMATFAMGVSDLTIINIMGESMTEMTEILQIAILAMARLESTGMKSDILVVQHLQERNAARLDASKESFIKALQYAFELTKNSNSDMGTLDTSSLTGLIERVQQGSFLNQFSALKDGPTANASPSEAYHKDIIRLYERIFEISREHPIKKEFSLWSKIVEAYWGYVSKENFALRFKNAVAMVEFVNLEQRLAHMKELIATAFQQHFQDLQYTMKAKKKDKSFSRVNCAQFIDESTRAVPYTCCDASSTQCDFCKKAIYVIRDIQDLVKAGDFELNTNMLIESYLQNTRKHFSKMLLDMHDALEIKEEFCEEFELLADKEIKGCLKRRSAGTFSKDEIKDITESIWKILVETTQEKFEVQPVRHRIEIEIAEMYKANSDFIDNYYKKDVAIKINSGGIASKLMGLFIKPREIDKSLEEQLTSRVCETVNEFVTHSNADRFDSEMINRLKKQIDDVITHFTKEFGDHFDRKPGVRLTLAAHAFGMKIFIPIMEELEAKWMEENSAAGCLRSREDHLKQQIAIRLQHGFDSASEGVLAGNQLFEAIIRRAECLVDKKLVDKVLDQSWTTTADKIRLLYFDELVQDVQKKRKQKPLSHFEKPKSSLEHWFITKVDDIKRNETNRHCIKYAQQQLQLVCDFVSAAISLEDLIARIENYVNFTNGLTFKLTQCASLNFYHFQEHIMRRLKELKTQISVRVFRLSNPSDNITVMNRLGCTESCPWCGALCWGARGHMENNIIQNSTQHYTCHQPSGLIGVSDHKTHELIAMCCENFEEDSMVFFGEYIDTGILWTTAKQKHFSAWNFNEYPKPQFQKMMLWFFFELHPEIARKVERLPATRRDLQKYGFYNLNIRKIMSYVKNTIGPI